ncbi:MAG TPA: EscU/YscU/HrcU family type III secretion system export apparatus switch protein [Candidatus Didemnitutus sp.]|nr:EscU/YscU/HrcU family type III secretion system export apparatus switch protein [Candidatus Didemnitutus sp.]
MADQDNDQKTEQPTERKLNEAAERGQFARTPELSVLLMLGAALGVLAFTAESTAQTVAEYATGVFGRFATTHLDLNTVTGEVNGLLAAAGKMLLPVLIACVGAALFASGLQSGFQLSPKAMTIKFEQLNPVAGFSRIFSKATLVRSGLDLLKLGAIASALYMGTRSLLEDPLFTAPVEAGYLAQFLNHATIAFLTRLLLALGVITAVSYGWEKFKTSRDLMMTRQEVKDERKNSEGDMLVKGAMRRMARRLMQKQMLEAVATADVVVTNPTHFAVALKYERGLDKAPVILAKGENRFAQRIKALAAENGVPMVENKPVARLLFAMGKVGEGIPPELYQAIAEILAVVYRTHRYYFHQLKTRRIEAATREGALGAA